MREGICLSVKIHSHHDKDVTPAICHGNTHSKTDKLFPCYEACTVHVVKGNNGSEMLTDVLT